MMPAPETKDLALFTTGATYPGTAKHISAVRAGLRTSIWVLHEPMVFKTNTALSRVPSLSSQDTRAAIAGTRLIPRISRTPRVPAHLIRS
jgi:hypothetical protein